MKWISVKDRLPEEGQWCLVGYRWTLGKKTHDSVEIKQFEKGIFYDGETEYYSLVGELKGVTHWMPLSDLPEIPCNKE